MLLHPYLLDGLVRQRQADFQAEAAHAAMVAEALMAIKVKSTKIARRSVRIVRTQTWTRHQPSLVSMRTDMPA